MRAMVPSSRILQRTGRGALGHQIHTRRGPPAPGRLSWRLTPGAQRVQGALAKDADHLVVRDLEDVADLLQHEQNLQRGGIVGVGRVGAHDLADMAELLL